jgi:hypothetical protein
LVRSRARIINLIGSVMLRCAVRLEPITLVDTDELSLRLEPAPEADSPGELPG